MVQIAGATLYSATTATAGKLEATLAQVNAPSHRRCRTLLSCAMGMRTCDKL